MRQSSREHAAYLTTRQGLPTLRGRRSRKVTWSIQATLQHLRHGLAGFGLTERMWLMGRGAAEDGRRRVGSHSLQIAWPEDRPWNIQQVSLCTKLLYSYALCVRDVCECVCARACPFAPKTRRFLTIVLNGSESLFFINSTKPRNVRKRVPDISKLVQRP